MLNESWRMKLDGLPRLTTTSSTLTREACLPCAHGAKHIDTFEPLPSIHNTRKQGLRSLLFAVEDSQAMLYFHQQVNSPKSKIANTFEANFRGFSWSLGWSPSFTENIGGCLCGAIAFEVSSEAEGQRPPMVCPALFAGRVVFDPHWPAVNAVCAPWRIGCLFSTTLLVEKHCSHQLYPASRPLLLFDSAQLLNEDLARHTRVASCGSLMVFRSKRSSLHARSMRNYSL